MITKAIIDTNYSRTNEACKQAGISRATFFRWVKIGIIRDVKHRDRRGWRLFSQEDIERLKKEVNEIKVTATDE